MPKKRCIIIGSSPETKISEIIKNVKNDDFIVCADGGYVFAEKAGIKPDLIIGDFDSAVFPKDASCEIIDLPVKKDDTDTLFAVKECIKRGFDNFVILGSVGGRTDHTFANICTLKFLSDKKLSAVLIGANTEIFVLGIGKKQFCKKVGNIFSIFPFGCDKCEVTLKGFLYELSDGLLSADFPIGVSNEITDEYAEVTILKGTAVIMLENKI